MKRTINQLFMMVIILMTCITASVLNTQAASAPKFKEKKVYSYFKEKTTDIIKLNNIAEDAKVTVKSSNTKVATVSYHNARKSDMAWFDENNEVIKYGVNVNIKKPGTTKITCIVKQNEQTYKLLCTYVVKKYKNPISSFKIGSVNYASEFKKTDTCYDSSKLKKEIGKLADKCKEPGFGGEPELDIDKFEALLKKTKVRIKISPKKGYKLKTICFYDQDETKRKIKNGSKRSYSDLMGGYLEVELKDKKGGSIWLTMSFPETEEFYW